MIFNINKYKVAILATFSAFVLLLFTFGGSPVFKTEASIDGPPAGRTGAPGESTCTSCHSQNSLTGQFNIVAPANYTPGQTYPIQVQNVTSDATRSAWGFELTTLTASNTAAGTYANTTSFTRTRTGSGKNYVEQNTAGVFSGQTGGSTWTFNWTAPATNVGPVTFYAAGLQANDNQGESGDQTYTKSVTVQPIPAVVIHHGFMDFDGDGKADPSVYRASDLNWHIDRSSAGYSAVLWGLPTDKLTPADFDGDDKTDIAVWRPDIASAAAFYILQSSNNTFRLEIFGMTGDDSTIVGDWDGDGKADPAVYRNSAVGSQSYFYYRGSLNNPGGNITFIPWGTNGDKAIRGDYDGDGKIDPAVFRPSNAVWYINQSSNGLVRYDNWGLGTDKLVVGDYDGDSKTDLAVFRAGTWYIKQSSNGLARYLYWGLGSDSLVPADYDGDAKTDVAVYRNGIWYIWLSSSGSGIYRTFGLNTDFAIANAFVK